MTALVGRALRARRNGTCRGLRFLLVLGGGLWYRGQQRKQAEWRRIVAVQKAEEEARQRAEDERRAQEAAHEKMLAVEKSARDRDSCIANLKQIEAAMEQCLIGGKIPTPEHLYGPDRYLRNEPTCPLGGHYKINKSDRGYTVVCPHADEGHRWPLSGAPNIITANWEVVPSARLVAKVGSREVFGATFRMDGLEYTSPVVLDNLHGRASIGPFKVTYSEDDKRYEGALESIPVNWRGPKTIVVSLKEYTGPKHGDTKTLTLPGGAKMEMIYVGPGSFVMGSPQSEEGMRNDEAQYRVTLTKGFWLGKYEVTQEQWESVMGGNPSSSGSSP